MQANKGGIVELEQVIDLINQELVDANSFIKHQQAGTLDSYYDDMINRIAGNMVLLPLQREFNNLDPLTNPHEVINMFKHAADIISTVFGKTPTMVHSDMIDAVENFPADDYRHAIYLRQTNALN